MTEVTAVFIPIIAIIMVFSIPIVAMVVEYKQKRNKTQLVQKAIELGTPIDNLKLDEPKKRLPYRSGMVMLAIGIGVIIFGVVMGNTIAGFDQGGTGAFFGGGAIVGLIGLALLINDRMNYDRFFKNDD